MWLGLLALGTPVLAQILAGVTRYVDIIELTDHDDQADIVVQFNCSLRYNTHIPASEGTELRIQLQPLADCGGGFGTQIAGELPPLSGGENIISAVRVESDVPGQVTLVFDWNKVERFVLVQGVDPRGLRIRLFDRARASGKVMVGETLDAVTNFAINLDSQPKEFDLSAIKLAEERFKSSVYVATATIDGVTWHRLRVGPIANRAAAEALLKVALKQYPRAWLAIADDGVSSELLSDNDEVLPSVEQRGSDPALDQATLAMLLDEARTALAKRDYAQTITLLTKLQRQPEFPERAQVQELLGLARERAGQLAHAKAEYEEYLRRYPKGEAAERVALRLRILRAASLNERTESGGSPETGWKLSGGIAQLYRYDGSRIASTNSDSTVQNADSQTTDAQNGLYNDIDVLARRRGEKIDLLGRISAGYAKNFSGGSSANANIIRVSVASFEAAVRNLGLVARLGRQSRNTGGVLGAFDGAFVSWNWTPSWGVGVIYGYPVEQTNKAAQTARRIESLSLAYTPQGAHWDASVYVAQQDFLGLKDRQAVGTELRYLGTRASLIALIDYDTFFRSLNTAALLGTLQLPGRWSLSVDAEKRNSPILATRNALIGQPVNTIAELEQVFLPNEVYQLARDRTPVTSIYSLTATRPLGERFQFSTTVAASETAETVASGGVTMQPSTGLNTSYQAQLFASSIFRSGDFNVLSFNYSDADIGKLTSLGLTSRFQLHGAWRLGPRLTINHRQLSTDNSTETIYVPALLLDYQKGSRLLQFEGGGQLGKRSAGDLSQTTTRYYVSLAYRLGF
ncbi:MAG: SPOR domain-containing protein [Steroidobacteraceae bacterium]